MKNDNRLTRLKGRDALRRVTGIMACVDCGRRSVMTGGNVGVRYTEKAGAGFAGLSTCGRVWLCPVCNAKIMARRALEIGVALRWAAANDLHIVWGSLTCRHSVRDPLADLMEIQRTAWRAMVSGRAWRDVSTTMRLTHVHDGCEDTCERRFDTVDTGAEGRVGYIRATELTIGNLNGWHPHYHPMIFVRGSEKFAQWIADDAVDDWVTAVQDAGGDAVREGGQMLRVVDVAEGVEVLNGYVTKATYEWSQKLALEQTWSQSKDGRVRNKAGNLYRSRVAGTSSHWSLLEGARQGLADDVERWEELEKATAGQRMITWSRGLRDFAEVGAELTDEQVAAQEVGTADDTVCIITGAGWEQIRDLPEVLAQLLNVQEQHGWAGLHLFLIDNGIEFTTLEDLADVSDTQNQNFYANSRQWEEANPAVYPERV